MKKILFLDIDGVLNTVDDMRVRHLLYISENKNFDRVNDDYGQLFDDRCVRWLDYIIQKTGCEIVISSTWRMHGLKFMINLWNGRNLPGQIVDITPFKVDPKLIVSYDDNSDTYNDFADRGYEIQEWININKPYRYCIIDDDNDMLKHQNFVRINSEFGITYDNAIEIISILNSNKYEQIEIL